MAEKKTSKKPAASRKTTVKAASAKKTTAKKVKATSTVSAGSFASANGSVLKLGALKPAAGSRPKRQRIGRGHGSGMVKTGGEGGKGQTVRSGGGKGPAFEGGQTPWARRLPQKLGVSQKARDIGHFRSRFAVVNLWQLADWEPSLEVNPQTLQAAGIVKQRLDGIKILGATRSGKTLPTGLSFRDVMFSGSAREALAAAGARFEE
ncbi:MAG: 50S ribosomal protein L15 [Candidatus Eremiobacteraeota bacterium]|nr:50S ribosomal protein L15 [Candidatus Eremiobacteraeota bacterium]